MGLKGFTRASTLGPIIDVIAAAGGSPSRVFSRADLPLTLQQSPDVFVPLKDHFGLLLMAAHELSDELFAARLGRTISVADLGTYGKWVVTAPTLVEALRRANQSLRHMLQSATDLRVRVDGLQVSWSYDSRDSATEGRQHNEMLALSFMVEMVREYLGPTWHPDRVLVGGRAVNDRAGLDQIFGAPVEFHDGPGTLVFASRLLATHRPPTATRSLDPTELGRAIDVPSPDSLHDVVSALIALELTERLPTIAWTARKIGASERTLQRRLAAAGTSFSELAGASLQQRAFDLLRDPTLSVTAVAAELGYADAAHFTRAFKRWTGIAPREWRAGLYDG